MSNQSLTYLKGKLDKKDFGKLERINNTKLFDFLAKYIRICNPTRVFICSDDKADLEYIRESAIRNGEEIPLAISGHTIHFDNYFDQARDKEHTVILVPNGMNLGEGIKTADRDSSLEEIMGILNNIMEGKELYVRFFCLGPTHSEFSIPAVQLTDSSYVAHSEDLLYRQGYAEFIRQGAKAKFFKFVHSQGDLDERNTCKNLHNRRVYIDLQEETVYSTNTQYGGNTIGLKKLAMRLAIKRGAREGWLTEHMLVLGVHGPNNRVTYFTGAFPSLCGKTSTAMMEGETIVGDDIAYLRKKDGRVRAVNAEKGVFGIITGINSKDDPIQWRALHSPNEVIFSNVLMTPNKMAYWIGKDGEVPEKGINYSGEWWLGKKDQAGKEIKPSHPNARFTISLIALENLDPSADDPDGVIVSGIVYGGRDADTSLPVEQAFNWNHGISTKGAALESETTAATLGKAGVRVFNPMSNLDFLSISIGEYIQKNLEFGEDLEIPPSVFSVNYFLLDKEGNFLTEKNDKKVWYKWMELRVSHDVDALEIPTGYIPQYQDLKVIFREVLLKEYNESDYRNQFTVRIPENFNKLDRIEKIFKGLKNAPNIIFEELNAQRKRLSQYKEKYGEYIDPFRLLEERN
jgi:phosphoenolpyruvate carboxykinase (GTP)